MPDMSRRWEHEPRPIRRQFGKDPDWRKHEKRSAERTGGKDRPLGIGHQFREKDKSYGGDGTSFGTAFLREVKSTINDSLSVKKAWLEQLDVTATMRGKKPLLVLGFEGMRPGVDREWAVVPLQFLKELMEKVANS